MFGAPGKLRLSDELLRQWNALVDQQFTRLLQAGYGSKYAVKDPLDVAGANLTTAIAWPASPAEPRFCLSDEWAQKLSDWGVDGRHETQNEYCEYHLTTRVDAEGKVRPKRLEFTTELREFWLMLAEHAPDVLADHAEDVLGRRPTWAELYGPGVSDPLLLPAINRRVAFATFVAGHGLDRDLQARGVPVQPMGSLNRDNALFMSHPINGLDDLIYIVLFGATPYGVREGGGVRKAALQEIFRNAGVTHLACRNADPAAAAGAYDAVNEGRQVAFADPLGMYLRPLNTDQLSYEDRPIPDEWLRYGRGEEGCYQRLVFGPSDEEDAFLDDIRLQIGASSEPITGGYEVAKLFEVGPLVVAGPTSVVAEEDRVDVPSSPESINCREADICRSMTALKERYESTRADVVAGTRGGHST